MVDMMLGKVSFWLEQRGVSVGEQLSKLISDQNPFYAFAQGIGWFGKLFMVQCGWREESRECGET